jgi:hypothetical protein
VPCPASSSTSATDPGMAPPSFKQQARRARFESVIAIAAPFLDLLLAAGDRVSRVAGPPDDHVAIRPPSEALELGVTERGSSGPIDD